MLLTSSMTGVVSGDVMVLTASSKTGIFLTDVVLGNVFLGTASHTGLTDVFIFDCGNE